MMIHCNCWYFNFTQTQAVQSCQHLLLFMLRSIVLANLVPTELLVREGRGHGNVTSLFLQVKRIICVREVLLHIDQVVTDGRNLQVNG